MKYISFVPARRTTHAVDAFDYSIPNDAVIHKGDIIRAPFRNQEIVGMIVDVRDTSAIADKTKHIPHPAILLSAGYDAVTLLTLSAERSFCSRPSVLHSWIRTIPKKAKGLNPSSPTDTKQITIPLHDIRYTIDRISEIKKNISTIQGRVLILVPWQERAETLSASMHIPALHAKVSTARAWNIVQNFATGSTRILVTTRIGAWLSLFADTVIIDEPENDDFKQDEMNPRLDARWMVNCIAHIRKNMSTIQISTTPSITHTEIDWHLVPDLNPHLIISEFQSRGRSHVDAISSTALLRLEHDSQNTVPCFIVHPIRGERARFVCRDCGWIAPCTNCGFVLSRLTTDAVCRKCGKKSRAPSVCAHCNGIDLSKSISGGDRVREQIKNTLGDRVHVIGLANFWNMSLPEGATIVITDIALIGGAVEDIRRKERLAICFRRLCAIAENAKANLILQGEEKLIAQCRMWLTARGLQNAWKREIDERALFGYPPSFHMAKLLIDGDVLQADMLYSDVLLRLPTGYIASAPLPVPYRPISSKSRFCMQISAPITIQQNIFVAFLQQYVGKAIIDLDPIAFFR